MTKNIYCLGLSLLQAMKSWAGPESEANPVELLRISEESCHGTLHGKEGVQLQHGLIFF